MVCRVNALALSIVSAALLAQALAPAGEPRVVARTFPVMGTEVTFSAFTADPEAADRGFTAAYDEIRRVERLMTDWERPGEPESDIVRINKAAGKHAVKVSAETVQVIQQSLDIVK